MTTRFAWAIGLAALTACKEDPPPRPDTGSTVGKERWIDGVCVVAWECPGAFYCDDFPSQRTQVHDSVQLECKFNKECPATGEAGRCGESRYVRLLDVGGETVIYFDPSDKPFAMRSVSPGPAIFCDGKSKTGIYGRMPKCEHVLTEDFVPDSPTPRLGRMDAGPP